MVEQEGGGEGRAHDGEEGGGADGGGAGEGPDVGVEELRPGEALAPCGGFGGGGALEQRGGGEAGGEQGGEVSIAQEAAVGEERGGGDEEQEEINVVVAADAVVDPDAVVVLALDAGAAEGAVFAARGFGVLAGGAEVAGVEEEVVVGVGCQGGVVGGVEGGGGRSWGVSLIWVIRGVVVLVRWRMDRDRR